jgi:hypothetical protein
MNAGKVNEVEVEAGLGPSCDNEQGNKGQRDRAVPKKASNNYNEKEVEAMEKLLVVGVLHLSHSAKLFGPQRNQKAAFQDQSTLGQLLFLSQKGTDLIGLFRLAYLQ